ncbi:MAG: fluoride efflux transporter CrcB [Nitrospirae bacterium]|nr:fluoride efflux transporter CrcB [Candidatus Manganitrophaceae bacterium]
MTKVLFIGLGGFLGAILRYWVSGWAQNLSGSASFPYGTLAVNLMGCLAVGLLSQWAEVSQIITPETRLFLFIGLLGAFTTFSTFSNETLNLLRDGQTFLSLMNIGASLFLGLLAVWLGHRFGQIIWK